MDTARCKAFVAAVEEGTIRDAAEKLGYTPSAVSQLIAAFEKELGISLLTRSRKGVKVTEDGALILPIARRIIEQELQMYQIAADIKGLLKGSITVACYSSIATFWLPHVLASFKKEYPGVIVNFREGTWTEMNLWLEEKTVDMAFTSIPDEIEYECFPLAEDRMVALLSKDHPKALADSFLLKEMSKEELIISQQGKDPEAEFIMKENGIPMNIRFTTQEPYSSMAMIEKGLGVGIMNELITHDWKDRIRVLPIEPSYQITLGIMIPSLEQASPAAKCFLQYAVKMLTKSSNNK